MPTRTDTPAAKGGAVQKATPAKADAVATTKPGTTKSALQKYFEDFAQKLGVKYKTIEERPIEDGGKKYQVLFIDFPKGTAKQSMMELLYGHITTGTNSAYSVEIYKEEEIFLFFKH
jgi:hypothetical protein